ncbi:LacI family transcriptional regulator [Verrucomicrobia bacterium LW23]|nr:LacI family transcriptional regulator [Verrucomicrobia bacterium LW23]
MSDTANPVTLKMIAQVAGVTHPTVSRALRNDSRNISEATCKRIQEIARSLGYRPDPAMSALIAHRTRVRQHGEYTKIAVLNGWGNTPMPPYMREQLKGMNARARELGYHIEVFALPEDPSGQARLSRTLAARGIRGIIVGPMPATMQDLHMEWKHFSVVSVGFSVTSPRLAFVASNHFFGIETIYNRLKSQGYNRIGFLHHVDSERRNRNLYLSSYLKCLVVEGITHDEAPPLLPGTPHAVEPMAWIKKHRFDAIICGWHESQRLLSQLITAGIQVPQDIAIAAFGISHETVTTTSGLAEDWHGLGVEAVSLLQSFILAGKRGVSHQRNAVFIDPVWKPGETVREPAAAASAGAECCQHYPVTADDSEVLAHEADALIAGGLPHPANLAL